jgi:hypothetical protein
MPRTAVAHVVTAALALSCAAQELSAAGKMPMAEQTAANMDAQELALDYSDEPFVSPPPPPLGPKSGHPGVEKLVSDTVYGIQKDVTKVVLLAGASMAYRAIKDGLKSGALLRGGPLAMVALACAAAWWLHESQTIAVPALRRATPVAYLRSRPLGVSAMLFAVFAIDRLNLLVGVQQLLGEQVSTLGALEPSAGALRGLLCRVALCRTSYALPSHVHATPRPWDHSRFLLVAGAPLRPPRSARPHQGPYRRQTGSAAAHSGTPQLSVRHVSDSSRPGCARRSRAGGCARTRGTAAARVAALARGGTSFVVSLPTACRALPAPRCLDHWHR